jgi:flagellar biosynthesis protein FlhF
MNTAPPNPAVQVIPFVADSAEDAVAQIRAKLGPDAVVVNVRQVPADGLAKLWKNPRIEVLAYKPDAKTAVAGPDPFAELKLELQSIKEQLAPSYRPRTGGEKVSMGESEQGPAHLPTHPPAHFRSSPGLPAWRAGEVLESSGLLPVHAQRVIEQLQSRHGGRPPGSLSEELVLARSTLSGLWPALPDSSRNDAGIHVLVGPPGAGKTTCICKWLAQARLIEGRSARVWRLDGATANAAESLSVYCEILGAPAERTWDGNAPPSDAELNFIDLPGVDWRNPAAVHELKEMIGRLEEGMPSAEKVPRSGFRVPGSALKCRVHLVLNAAYEAPLMVAQARAFASLPIEDLILTHLDEEPRWGKIWNVVLGTNYPVRFLSAAQNVPGEFLPATAERILSRQFAS